MPDRSDTPPTILRSDGRRLAYAEYGARDGIPVFHFNGSGGSRLEWPGDAAMLENIGVRFIGIDRPGHGYSTFQDNRTLLGWADDVTALADHLNIGRFFVEGWSAGGAYALACAYKLRNRIIAGAILSGIGPFDRPSPYDGLNEQIKSWMINARNYPDRVHEFRATMAAALERQSAESIGTMLAGGDAEDDRAVAAQSHLQIAHGYERQGRIQTRP